MALSPLEYFQESQQHIGMLGQASNDLAVQFVSALEDGDSRILAEAATRSRRVDQWVDGASREHISEVIRLAREELGMLAKAEAQFQRELMQERFPESSIVLPTAVLAAALAFVQSTAFANQAPTSLRDELSRWRHRATRTLGNSLRQAEREGTRAAVNRTVLGTRRRSGRRSTTDGSVFTGGARAPDRRALAAWTKTAVDAVASETKSQLHESTPDVDRVVWISLFDSRVCPMCAVLSGRIFPIGSGPRPPIHMRDRCHVHALAVGEDMVDILGPDADLGFEPFLRRQSARQQDELLGRAAGILFRRGRLPLDAFVSVSRRRRVTLPQLFRKFPGIAEPLRDRVQRAARRTIAA